MHQCNKSTPKSVKHSQNESSTLNSSTEPSVDLTMEEETDRYVCKINSPKYSIYRDNDIDVAVKNTGNIPKELQDRLIRATVSNMISTAYMPPFNRKPTKAEFLEMAKSLTIVYPCLSDPDQKHVNQILLTLSLTFQFLTLYPVFSG